MAKRKRISKKKIIRFILIIVLFLVLIFGIIKIFHKKEVQKVKKEVKVEDKIKKYNYEITDYETEYGKLLFKNLKSILNETKVDEEKYASTMSQLFLTQFFTLDNKLSNNDVGGLQFVYSDFQGDFEKYAKDSIYRYVESNIYGDRKQELPIVSEVTILNIEKTPADYLEETDEEAYQVDLKISYEQDMGYQETATLVLVHHDSKLEIVKMTE